MTRTDPVPDLLWLGRVFPFLLRVTPDLRVSTLGTAWGKVCPGEVGEWAIEDALRVLRPIGAVLSWDHLQGMQGLALQLLFLPTAMEFRGSFVSRGEYGLLVIAPVVRSTNDLARFGLSLGDFPAHDATGDLLLTIQTLSTSLSDANELTERLRKSRKELVAARKHAEEASVVARKAAEVRFQFLAAMSHEIRTPLHGVLGIARLLRATTLDVEQDAMLSTLVESGNALLSLVNDVLDFSKLESGAIQLDIRPFSPLSTVESVVELLAATASGKGVELVVVCDVDCRGTMLGDSDRVRQVLLNLVGNAIKFTLDGEVTIRVRVQDGLLIEIVDTGIGMSPAVLSTLFQPFRQADVSTRRRFGGTGLGLSISKRLVDAMGGRIDVESKEGVGTLFRLFLPLPLTGHPTQSALVGRVCIVEPNPAALSAMEQWLAATGLDVRAVARYSDITEEGWDVVVAPVVVVPTPITNNQKFVATVSPEGLSRARQARPDIHSFLVRPVLPLRLERCVRHALRDSKQPVSSVEFAGAHATWASLRVLVAEDNPVNRMVMDKTLRHLGVEAVLVNNGLHALQRVIQEPFDLVLMDCQMPEMDGYEATRQIRSALGGSLMVVALTANAMPEDRLICEEAGMDDYLTKPLATGSLERVLGDAAQRARNAHGGEAS